MLSTFTRAHQYGAGVMLSTFTRAHQYGAAHSHPGNSYALWRHPCWTFLGWCLFFSFLGGLVDRGKFCSRPNYCVPKPGSAVVFYARGSYASSLQGMDSGPGKLVGEDCRVRERERDVCDGMASDGNGSMEVDSVSVGGGATILEGQRSSGAGLDVAAADGTGRAGAEQNMATVGSTESQGLAAAGGTGRVGAEENRATAGGTESQGLAALEASLRRMLERMTRNQAAGNSAQAVMDDVSVRSSRFTSRLMLQLCSERPAEVAEAWRATLDLFKTTFHPAGPRSAGGEFSGDAAMPDIEQGRLPLYRSLAVCRDARSTTRVSRWAARGCGVLAW